VRPCPSRVDACGRKSHAQASARLDDIQAAIPWRQVARMRDHLAHRCFDTAHVVLQATVDEDLPELERAVQALLAALPEDPAPG